MSQDPAQTGSGKDSAASGKCSLSPTACGNVTGLTVPQAAAGSNDPGRKKGMVTIWLVVLCFTAALVSVLEYLDN